MSNTTTDSTTAKRRFECVEGTSRKFWEVSLQGSVVMVRFGRIGTSGRALRKPFDQPIQAQQHLKKLLREKTAKGYVEVAGR